MTFMSCRNFKKFTLKDGKESKFIVKEGNINKFTIIFCVVVMLILNILKGGLLVYALVFGKAMPLYSMFFTDSYNTQQVLMEGGLTIIIESLLITLNFRCMTQYKPLVFNIKDCYYWMKKKVRDNYHRLKIRTVFGHPSTCTSLTSWSSWL